MNFKWVLIILAILLITPKMAMAVIEAEGTSNKDSIAFVILRHVNNEEADQLWKRCYTSIRQFYSEEKIIIIDDNSKIPTDDQGLTNTSIIYSDYPGAGELLPYFYFLHYKWADRMVFLHDSMFLIRAFNESEINTHLKFHWHFENHIWDDNQAINALLSCLPDFNSLIEYNMNKSLWNGCFGVATIIHSSVLEDIEKKYNFTCGLIDKIHTRKDRTLLERVFAIIAFKEGYVTKETCSNFDSILEYPGSFHNGVSIEVLKLIYPGAILKTWHGR